MVVICCVVMIVGGDCDGSVGDNNNHGASAVMIIN